jgi:hypothetical protein
MDEIERTLSANLQSVCWHWQAVNTKLMKCTAISVMWGICLGECFQNYCWKTDYREWSCQVNFVNLTENWVYVFRKLKLFYFHLWANILLYKSQDLEPWHCLIANH